VSIGLVQDWSHHPFCSRACTGRGEQGQTFGGIDEIPKELDELGIWLRLNITQEKCRFGSRPPSHTLNRPPVKGVQHRRLIFEIQATVLKDPKPEIHVSTLGDCAVQQVRKSSQRRAGPSEAQTMRVRPPLFAETTSPHVEVVPA
jgi:hypothetical protein